MQYIDIFILFKCVNMLVESIKNIDNQQYIYNKTPIFTTNVLLI